MKTLRETIHDITIGGGEIMFHTIPYWTNKAPDALSIRVSTRYKRDEDGGIISDSQHHSCFHVEPWGKMPEEQLIERMNGAWSRCRELRDAAK